MASHAIVYLDPHGDGRLEAEMQEAWENPLVTFTQGDALIAYLRKLQPAQLPRVIVLDLEEPGDTTSYDLVRWIREEYGQHSAPVTVVVSGENDKTAMLRARDAGAKYYVIRPVVPQSLFAIVRREPMLASRPLGFTPAEI